MNASDIIDKLGGTVQVSKLCEIKPQSVSEWRHKGIPRVQERFLRLLRPDVFGVPTKAGRKSRRKAA